MYQSHCVALADDRVTNAGAFAQSALQHLSALSHRYQTSIESPFASRLHVSTLPEEKALRSPV